MVDKAITGEYLDVVRIGKAGDTQEISLGFIRRYKIFDEEWKMGLRGQLGRYKWALEPQDGGGGSIMERKIAWNTLEAMRAGGASNMTRGEDWRGAVPMGDMNTAGGPGMKQEEIEAGPKGARVGTGEFATRYRVKPAPLWWDMAGTDPNTGQEYEDGWKRWSKKIGVAMSGKKGVPGGATLAAAEELADIFDMKGKGAAKFETARPKPNAEEIWTEFWLEALSDHIEESGLDMPRDINDYTGWQKLNKDRNQKGYLQLINTMGFDFGAYTQSEAMEQAFFTALMDDVMSDTEWKSVGDMEGVVVAREQTSDQGGKFFARGLSEALETEKDMQTAFFKNTGLRVDEITANLGKYGTLREAIKNLVPEGSKGSSQKESKSGQESAIYADADNPTGLYGKFEGLEYISKQEADRAVSLAMLQFFGGTQSVSKGGAGMFDYFLPLPSHKAGGFQVGTWMGQIRLKPIVTQQKISGNVRFVLKAINYATRAYETGKMVGPGTTGGIPINAIIKHLLSTHVLTTTEVQAISSVARERYNRHATAVAGVAYRGGIFYGELAGEYAAAMGGASAKVNIVNVATSETVAQNIKEQIEAFFGGPQGGEAMAEWFARQGMRMKDLTKTWSEVPGMGPVPVIKARKKWAQNSKNKNLMNTKFGIDAGNPFRPQSITPEGGSLIGIPYFLAKGPYQKDKQEQRSPQKVKAGKIENDMEKMRAAKTAAALGELYTG